MQSLCANWLLQSLPAEDGRSIVEGSTLVHLKAGSRIIGAAEKIEAVYFPETLIATFSDNRVNADSAEIGMIGRDGMVGWHVLLGCRTSPHSARAIGNGGSALRVDVRHFHDLCQRSDSLKAGCLRFIHAYAVQIAHTSMVGCRFTIDRRLCRWLLMVHDRQEGDEIQVTHDFIASMLGTRRASITDQLHLLEGWGFLRNTRSRLVLLDRAGLESVAGEAYGHAEREYQAFIGPFESRKADVCRQRSDEPAAAR